MRMDSILAFAKRRGPAFSIGGASRTSAEHLATMSPRRSLHGLFSETGSLHAMVLNEQGRSARAHND
jgi:hypothetical protein